MRRFRRILCSLLLLFLLAPAMVLSAHATQSDAVDACIQQILSCWLNELPETEVAKLLNRLEDVDPVKADIWEKIAEQWNRIHQEMQINEKVLPDGLPQDDSMAIVVMGLQLNPNGSMKPEMLDRLQVAIASAEKYPNAYIICTGGPTGGNFDTTEAGVMADWLRINGIDESRILLEEGSFSTTENAQNTCDLLHDLYPQVNSLAIISSDYHIRRSCLMFSAASLYDSGYDGKPEINVISNAVCTVENAQEESLRTQIWGLAILAGVDMPET